MTTTTPRAFETGEVSGFVGAKTDDPTHTSIRVTRSAATCEASGVVFSIGTACLRATGTQVGFLLRTDSVTGVQAAVPLQVTYPSNGATASMTAPQALQAMDLDGHRVVVVMGGGVLDSPGALTNVTGTVQAAIAVVRISTMCCIQVHIGNGDSTFAGETYNDFLVDPWCCTGAAWLVAATGFDIVGEGDRFYTSILRRVCMETFMAQPLGPDGVLYTAPARTATYTHLRDLPTTSVSIAALSNMVVVGSHALVDGTQIQSFLWAATPQTLQPLQPATLVSYNDPATGFLWLVSDTETVDLLRVFALEDDAVVVVARGYINETSGATPATCTVQVFRYTPETVLDVGYATGGVLVWYAPDVVGGTYAMDARLVTGSPVDAPGTVIVVGNSFYTGTDSGTPAMAYDVPGFELGYLNVRDMHYDPSPFAIEVKGAVCTGASLVRTLFTYMCGCAVHWASSLAFTSPAALSLVVTGDSWFHLGCPSQSAYVFDLAVARRGTRGNGSSSGIQTRTCAPYIMNNTPVCCSALVVNPCGGAVVVDILCPPSTTLYVRGPVVVGCLPEAQVEPLAVQGMIRYDPDTRTLLYFNGDEWRTLSSTTPP